MTTQKKNLAEHAEAMGFEVPATATVIEEPVEGELMPEEETYEREYSDIPEHSSDALPIHQRSLPKVALAIGTIGVLFGLPAYLFLSAASGGGGATNTAKTDGIDSKDKDKKPGLQDPQTDEINKLKTDLAIGKQLASVSPSPSPSIAPTPDDKTTTKPTSSLTPTPPLAPTVSTTPPTPIVAKVNPQAAPPSTVPAPASPKPVVAKARPQTPTTPLAQPPSVVAPVAARPPASKAISPAVAAPAVAKAEKPLAPPSAVLVAKTNPKPVQFSPKNPPVTTTPVALVKPEPKSAPSLPPVAKINPAPQVASASLLPPVAPAPKIQPPVALAAKPPTPSITWEQASAIAVYGGDPSSAAPAPVGVGVKDAGKDTVKQQQSKYEGALSPLLQLAAGTNVKGHTIAPYAEGTTNNESDAMPLSIALDEPIELGKGYHLPIGTIVHFMAKVRDNGSVVALSKNADIGGVEIQLPEGAITLAAENNSLLMAKEIITGGGDLARVDVTSSIWGGAAAVGKAIVQAGTQTTTNTGLLGTTTTQTNSGTPNILGAVIDGAFTPLASNGQKRAQQTAERIQQRTRLNAIDVGTKVKLFVNAPINIQIPVSNQPQTETEDDGESQPSPRLAINAEQEPQPQQKAIEPSIAGESPKTPD